MENNLKKLSIIIKEFGAKKFFSIDLSGTGVRLMGGFDKKLNRKLHNNPKWSAELSVESNHIRFTRFDITIIICLDL